MKHETGNMKHEARSTKAVFRFSCFLLLVSCFVFFASCLLLPVSCFASDASPYISLGKPVSDAIWGVTKADMLGLGKSEIYFVSRDFLYSYQNDEPKIVLELGDLTKAHHLYACDLDDDARDEIVVAGVRPFGHYSYIIQNEDGKISKSVYKSELRVIKDANGKCVLLERKGKKIYSLQYSDGKLGAVEKIKKCSQCDLYNFNYLSTKDLVRLSSDGVFELWEDNGKRYRKVWRGGRTLGRSLNILDGEVFSLAPLPIDENRVLAVQYQQPIAQIVGKAPYTEASKLVILKRDGDLGFVEVIDQKWLPALITDYILDKGDDGEAKGVIYTMQVGGNIFKDARKSIVGYLEF